MYSATKYFVLIFTENVATELEDSGVIVTALCPGPVDTRFQTDAMRDTNANMTTKLESASNVAKAGVKLLLHGKG